MPDFGGLGRVILITGLVLVAIGALLMWSGKWPNAGQGWGWLGRLPGDIFVKRDHFTFYFPIATSILLSIVGSLLLYFFIKR